MKLLVILVSSLALGCAEQREYTMVEIKEVPKTGHKTVKSKSVSMVHKDGRWMPAQVEIVDIGPTLNAEGDLVGPRKLYRVVETSHWILGKPRIITPTTFVKENPTDDLNKAVSEAKTAAVEAKAANDSLQKVVSKQGQGNPTPSDEVAQQVKEGFQAYQPSPTPGASPTPDADHKAFNNFSQSAANPNVP